MANNSKKYASLTTLQTFLDNLKNFFAAKSDVDTALASKSDLTHNHDSKYDAKGSANVALDTSKTYTDNVVSQKTQVQIITWGADD